MREPDPSIQGVLRRLSGGRDAAATISPLGRGAMNTAYLLRISDEKYVVRVPGGERASFVDPLNERYNATAAAVAGVAPRVVDYLDDDGVLVVEYLKGEALTPETLGRSEQIPRVAAALRRLHAGPRFRNDVDWFATVEDWLRRCDEHEVAVPAELLGRMDALREASAALHARSMPTVPSHNDLMPGNIVDDGRRLWFLDFEYSGNNDPCYDVADVVYQSELDDDWRARLCEAYFGRADPYLLARMSLHSLIGAAAWCLWAAVQARHSSLEIDYAGISAAYLNDVVEITDGDEFEGWVRAASRGTSRPSPRSARSD